MNGYKFIFEGDELELRLTLNVARLFTVETGKRFTDTVLGALGVDDLSCLLKHAIHYALKRDNKKAVCPTDEQVMDALETMCEKQLEEDGIHGGTSYTTFMLDFVRTSIMLRGPKKEEEEEENPTK